ncbi:low temperature requirement protein A [Streptomyces sp. NPDC127084]|uniref:low temperature requirement protein A n=1 Tax=Streptomyces sp. NPDC127084 TaxID=3347133 RepID=UPI003668DB6C
MSSVPESLRLRRPVSPLELFYDLVFVFAVSQLSHHLLEHQDWRGAAETAVLLVAVFGTWAYTSYEATLLDVHRTVTRWMVVIVMGLGLFIVGHRRGIDFRDGLCAPSEKRLSRKRAGGPCSWVAAPVVRLCSGWVVTGWSNSRIATVGWWQLNMVVTAGREARGRSPQRCSVMASLADG